MVHQLLDRDRAALVHVTAVLLGRDLDRAARLRQFLTCLLDLSGSDAARLSAGVPVLCVDCGHSVDPADEPACSTTMEGAVYCPDCTMAARAAAAAADPPED